MAAVAAAATNLDGGAGSVTTSPSMRRREADLSAESAAVAADVTTTPSAEDKEDIVIIEESTPNGDDLLLETTTSENALENVNVKKKQEPMNRKRANWVRGTPHTTLSILTVTTATSGEDGSGDDSIEISIPETSPVPEQVEGRNGREYDECSSLGVPNLEFQ